MCAVDICPNPAYSLKNRGGVFSLEFTEFTILVLAWLPSSSERKILTHFACQFRNLICTPGLCELLLITFQNLGKRNSHSSRKSLSVICANLEPSYFHLLPFYAVKCSSSRVHPNLNARCSRFKKQTSNFHTGFASPLMLA
jgi:hypothetical protein